MQLSVIVPCHDIEPFLDRCLDSLQDQDLGPDEYEVIVVDDGSTDDTASIAHRHAAADPRIAVLSQSNAGVSAARNAGLDRAAGTFIYFVDGDDYVASNTLRPVIEAMREHALDFGWVGSRRVKPGEVVPAVRALPGPAIVSDVVSGIEYMTDRHWANSVWAFLLSRQLLDRTGVRFEVGHILEDQLFTAKLLAAAQRVGTIEMNVYRYFLRPGSIMRSTDTGHAMRLHAEYEHVIHGLEQLRERTVAEGRATPAYLDRFTSYQQSYTFFLISRIIRATLPLRPTLPATLARLEGSGYYPLTHFPGSAHRDLHYRVLATCYNHRLSLYAFALAYRAFFSLHRGLRLCLDLGRRSAYAVRRPHRSVG